MEFFRKIMNLLQENCESTLIYFNEFYKNWDKTEECFVQNLKNYEFVLGNFLPRLENFKTKYEKKNVRNL